MIFNRLEVLNGELISDPLTRGYSGMDDQAAADNLNTEYRTRLRELIATWEIIEATVPAEYTSLSAAEKTRYQTFVAAGNINPAGVNTRAAFAAMFGAGTTTRSNLQALQDEDISRAEELEVGVVSVGDVLRARAL